MRKIWLFFLTFPAWGLSNAVTIHAGETPVPASQVHRTPRWFAEGEIPDFPRPFINGTGAETWQADVKNRWPDGTVRFAVVSFPAAIGQNGSLTVDFRNAAGPCHLGNQAACEAAALDGAAMLAYAGGTWDASIQAQADPAGSATQRAVSARTMIANGHFTYWLRGPVVTEVIAEDASPARSYDFGWTCTANCTQPYDTAVWADDLANRSLHPIFVLTFQPGMSTVRVQYSLANYWTTARQDQRYTLNLITSAGTVLTKSGLRAASASWWRAEFYDGPAPVPVRLDFNLPYLRYAKMVPPFKLGITVKQTGDYSIGTSLALWNSGISGGNAGNFPFYCSSALSICGSRLRTYSATGGRDDRGFYPLWEAHWLHSMDASLYDVVRWNADYTGTQPIHHRESATGLTYRAGTDAFGKPYSLNARPTLNLPATVGSVSSTFTGWSTDNAHMHTHAQLAYLVTGDWWYMQEQSFLGHYIFSFAQQAGYTQASRLGAWGFISANESNHRAVAWTVWNLWRAALIAPDGDPQQEYLKEKLADVLATFEGYWNVTDGDYYEPCTSNPYNPLTEGSRWCWGRKMMGLGIWPGTTRLSQLMGTQAQRNSLNTSVVYTGSSPWMDNFIAVAFFDLCRTEGRACGIARYHATKQANLVNQGGNPRMLTWYHIPAMKYKTTTLTQDLGGSQSDVTIHVADASLCPPVPAAVAVSGELIWIVAKDTVNNTLTAGTTLRGGRGYNAGNGLWGWGAGARTAGSTVYFLEHFESFAEMNAMYTGTDPSALAGVPVRPQTDGPGDGYVSIQCGTGMWSEDFSLSKRAGEIWQNNCHDNDLGGSSGKYSKESDPRWFLEPDREIHQVRAAAGGGALALSYVAPSGEACRVYLGSAPPPSSDDAADALDAANGRLHTFTAAGLSPGTYRYRISCGSVRKTGEFTIE